MRDLILHASFLTLCITLLLWSSRALLTACGAQVSTAVAAQLFENTAIRVLRF